MFSRAFSFESLPCDGAHGALAQVGAAARAALWTGEVFSTPAQGVWRTGFAELDAELPGGGWPGGGLIEILQDEAGGQDASRAKGEASPSGHVRQPLTEPGEDAAGGLARRLLQRWAARPGMPSDRGESLESAGLGWVGNRAQGLTGRWAADAAEAVGDRPQSGLAGVSVNSVWAPGAEWRLLLPMLARLPGGVTLIGPPAVPHAAALAQAGLALDDLVWVQADTPARRLWAAEQVLRAGLDGATLVWLPWASAMQLRRLQMAALASPGRVFVMRPASAAAQSSPAPLRLLLRSPRHDTLAVRVFKRRGPPAERDVELTAWPPGLEAIVAGQGWMTRRLREGWSPSRPQVRREQPPAQRPSSVPDPAATPFGAARPAEVSAVQPQEPFHVVAGLASA